jgi:hypothetical protein
MAELPDWCLHESRNAQERLHRLQRRFREIGRRHDRRAKFGRMWRVARGSAISALTIALLTFGAVTFSPFAPLTTLKHLPRFRTALRRGRSGWLPHVKENLVTGRGTTRMRTG